MKRPSTAARPLPNLLLGLWLLLASGFGAGGVLVCYGDDGHLQVGDHGCCPDAPASGPFWHQSDCGDCADIRLHVKLPAVAPVRAQPTAAPPAEALAFRDAPAWTGVSALSASPLKDRVAGPPPDPGLARRVVLQI